MHTTMHACMHIFIHAHIIVINIAIFLYCLYYVDYCSLFFLIFLFSSAFSISFVCLVSVRVREPRNLSEITDFLSLAQQGSLVQCLSPPRPPAPHTLNPPHRASQATTTTTQHAAKHLRRSVTFLCTFFDSVAFCCVARVPWKV